MNDFKKMVDLERRKAWVWANAREITGRDRRVWRRDSLGAVIRYCDYGNRSSPYGWTIEQNLAVRAEFPSRGHFHWRHRVSLRRDHSAAVSSTSLEIPREVACDRAPRAR